jgi:hypothetical protein
MMKMTGLQAPLLASFNVDCGSRLRISGTAVAAAVAAKTRLPNFMIFLKEGLVPEETAVDRK